MAVYRRFVAYVYEYRKGKKEKNCGFIRVEVWERRCRLEVHLQCPGLTPDAACRIYGFVRNGGLMDGYLLGAGRTEAGRFECALETDAANMGQHGIALKRMGGMILKTENGAFFGTEWDDQPVRPENFREIQKHPEPTARRERQESRPEETAPGKALQQAPGEPDSAPEQTKDRPEKAGAGETMSREKNAEPESMKPEESVDPEKAQPEQAISGEARSRGENAEQESVRQKEADAGLERTQPEPSNTRPEGMRPGETQPEDTQPEKTRPEETQSEAGRAEQGSESEKSSSESETNHTHSSHEAGKEEKTGAFPETSSSQESKASPESKKSQAAASMETSSPDLESQAVRDAADAPSPRPRHPLPGEEFVPFEDGELEEARKIRPRDLMRFRRQDCIFRNNRFLQYGYYNFGHLLLGRKTDGRYVLGVPGGYDQQERFMANMFGFPYFKESRYVELHGRRGGYWYRLIDAPDFH